MAKKKIKEKKFKLRFCPKCESSDVEVPLGAKPGIWHCKSCDYKGENFVEKEVSEEEFLAHFDVGEDFEFGEPETVEEKKSHKEMLKEKLARGEKI
jgi:transcription elongation factor Elf1